MNVLVALAWPTHVHHRDAIEWFVGMRDEGWATCPTTESGFVRVSSNTRALPDARPPSEAIELLARLRTNGSHTFWHDDTSITEDELGIFDRVVGFRHVTDAHLLSLAVRRGGALATFDRGIQSLATDHADRVALIAG